MKGCAEISLSEGSREAAAVRERPALTDTRHLDMFFRLVKWALLIGGEGKTRAGVIREAPMMFFMLLPINDKRQILKLYTVVD